MIVGPVNFGGRRYCRFGVRVRGVGGGELTVEYRGRFNLRVI